MPPPSAWAKRQRWVYETTTACALALERRHRRRFQRVVWFVASDHAPLKARLAADFASGAVSDGRRVLYARTSGRHSRIGRKSATSSHQVGDAQLAAPVDVPDAAHAELTWMHANWTRTRLHGHERAKPMRVDRTPQQYADDVSDAFVDWWLLGQADLAVIAPTSKHAPGNSFARSALARGLRTRSVYVLPGAGRCGIGEHTEF